VLEIPHKGGLMSDVPPRNAKFDAKSKEDRISLLITYAASQTGMALGMQDAINIIVKNRMSEMTDDELEKVRTDIFQNKEVSQKLLDGKYKEETHQATVSSLYSEIYG
jgi:hypothetical protein